MTDVFVFTAIDKKEILMRARDVLSEIDSYSELEQTIEAKLFSGPSPSPIRFRDDSYKDSRTEQLLDDMRACIAALQNERKSAADLIKKALEIIDAVKDGRKRAALRYYYLCRKSASKIADILDCDEKTIKRWIKEPF